MMQESMKIGVFMAIGTGGLFAIITALEGTISKAIGAVNASLLEHLFTGALSILFISVIISRGGLDLTVAKGMLPMIIIAGLLVLVGVAGVAYIIPKLGVTLGTFTLVFGQLFVAMLIDTFGLLGYEKVPFTPLRIVGILLMVAGIYIVLPKMET